MVVHSDDEFHLAYGKALASWAVIEDALCTAFCLCCKMNPMSQMGRSLFFSGRSFATRADLLSAAIPHSPFDASHQALLKALLKKARQFSSSRNAIAHGIPINLHTESEAYSGVKVKEGQAAWEAGGIGIDKLAEAEVNFDRLSAIIERAAWPRDRHEEYLRQVQELPNAAFARE